MEAVVFFRKEIYLRMSGDAWHVSDDFRNPDIDILLRFPWSSVYGSRGTFPEASANQRLSIDWGKLKVGFSLLMLPKCI